MGAHVWDIYTQSKQFQSLIVILIPKKTYFGPLLGCILNRNELKNPTVHLTFMKAEGDSC